MQYDYILAGQGISGSNLAFHLIKLGRKILVVDPGHDQAASKVAAGMFNPITGRKPVKTWLADIIFPYLHSFYSEMEIWLNERFYYPSGIYFPFDSPKKQNDWLQFTGDVFIDHFSTSPCYPGKVTNDNGGSHIKQGGHVDAQVLIQSAREKLIKEGILINETLWEEDVTFSGGNLHWKGIAASHLVCCGGIADASRSWWKHTSFSGVKGEILHIDMPDAGFREIINRGGWIVPKGNDRFIAGSTYHHDNLDWMPSEAGREEIERKIRNITQLPYTITGRRAGIRPTTNDRRPIVGRHHHFQSLYILNGMGTKGISLSPYLAHRLVRFIENNEPLPEETRPERSI